MANLVMKWEQGRLRRPPILSRARLWSLIPGDLAPFSAGVRVGGPLHMVRTQRKSVAFCLEPERMTFDENRYELGRRKDHPPQPVAGAATESDGIVLYLMTIYRLEQFK